MLEKDMEDLLWRYPDDFFPGRGFKPVERQFTLSGAGRLDISFRDNLERLWVIEVKAVAVRTEVADQVYRYAQSLREAHPHDRPFPAVVAPVINATVREHFDRWGIEYYEITEAMFRRVATERGVEIEPTELRADAGPPDRAPVPRPPKEGTMEYALGALPKDYTGAAERFTERNPDRPWPVHYVADQQTICDGRSTQTLTQNQVRAHGRWRTYKSAVDVTCRLCLRRMPT